MNRKSQATARPPALPRLLGYAGLLPQAAVVAVLVLGPARWHFSALSLGYAYPALILSFLGGMWWGLAARAADEPPAWVWLAAVAPSLLALATAIPWAVGATWPGPSLAALGVSLLLSLLVDRRLATTGRAPPWWMALRNPLSIGLGILTVATGAIG
ncbi:DUF3429 domain-containing protein [Novosphingobium sp. 9U]|uniref:DUF3429 domain-containing protein n=1 Tax=Novosphingobium sp. 9U TaxID=2653158 RepID=UPI0012EF5F8F|nr:DUF3429 domain-containing protein [Novosphingobium sp. 9U]VWX54173.1 conserved membrane hypothetical protein [Novosphingobium sp. 9U]